jgi:hypothetical protein
MKKKMQEYQLTEILQADYQRLMRHADHIRGDEDYKLLTSPVYRSEMDGETFSYPMGKYLDAFFEGRLKVTETEHLVALTATTESYTALVYNDQTKQLRVDTGDVLEKGNRKWIKELESLKTSVTLKDPFPVEVRLHNDLDALDA